VGKGWSIPEIVIGSPKTDLLIGTGGGGARVKRDSPLGKTSLKYTRYLVGLVEEVSPVQCVKLTQGT
jgi:hypothetical protein